MAKGLLLEFEGVGKAEYDKVNSELGFAIEDKAGWPAGLISHAAGSTETGMIVMEIWESQEAQGAFLENQLGAALASVGVTPPARMLWADLFAEYHA